MTGCYLAFGDSNTHGSMPNPDGRTFGRHPVGTRWPTVAAAALPSDRPLAEAGLPGRTTRFPDPVMGEHMDGRPGLKVALASHGPVAILSIMLGTNDLKARFGASPETIAAGLACLLDIVRDPVVEARAGRPAILVIAPPPVRPVGLRQAEWQGAEEKSRALAPRFRIVAEAYGAAFLDAGLHAEVAPEEGIHWHAEAHRSFGRAAGEVLAGLQDRRMHGPR
ncbi:lipolytic enzyme, G-D-S-L [Rhodobacterales bacterium HKCCE2091]|nr:lipolytic enzyme, G-D-S-L [Rhodobacterales bacterium HKCCE2091]